MSTTEPQFNDPPRPFHQHPVLAVPHHIGLQRAGALGSENRALVALGRQGTWKSFFQRSFFPWCRGL